jgi:hypothetical protein
MLVSESGSWQNSVPLNTELYREMRGMFPDSISREVLLAAAGLKISRTGLSESKLALLSGLAVKHNFQVVASCERYIHRRDLGKGGAANSIERLAGPEEDGGLRNVYIASNLGLAEAGKLCEEAGDDELFGLLLGIPKCCREAYARYKPLAFAKQNDFLAFALDNTGGEMPFDPWVNYAARYFGPTLLSFFPCSFRCPAAATVARATFDMLAGCDAAWADSFLDAQRTNVLYTEYQGLHLFRRPLVGGWIDYGPGDFVSTEPTPVADLIGRGDRLEVRGKREVHVYRGRQRIGIVQGEDAGMLVFL